jgi:hypothetical protein
MRARARAAGNDLEMQTNHLRTLLRCRHSHTLVEARMWTGAKSIAIRRRCLVDRRNIITSRDLLYRLHHRHHHHRRHNLLHGRQSHGICTTTTSCHILLRCRCLRVHPLRCRHRRYRRYDLRLNSRLCRGSGHRPFLGRAVDRV